MQDRLAPDASISYRRGLLQEIDTNKNLKYIVNACCVSIGSEVTYKDAKGEEKKLKAGTVVIAAGMKPKSDEAMAFYNAGGRFVMVGDCHTIGNLEKAMRTGFAASIVL